MKPTRLRAALGLAVLAVGALLLGMPARGVALETSGWQAIGPAGLAVSRLYTPTSGALLVQSASQLMRSDDAGLTWTRIRQPDDTDIVTVAPTSHELLYAAGSNGVYRSEDGGGSWTHVSDLADIWRSIEVSPADPNVVYGVTATIASNGTIETITFAFRVSRDAGATWEVSRTYDERRRSGSYPCGFTVRRIAPHAVYTDRVMTIEGCTVRGDPHPQMSADAGRTNTLLPDMGSNVWAASAAVGGQGVSPGRWYVSAFKGNILYTRVHHSKLMRTDDDGATWTSVFDEDSGEPYKNPKAVDFIGELAYNPQQPDHVFAVFERYVPNTDRYKELEPVGFTVRMSQDGGASWIDLGAGGLPKVNRLAVGIDGRYLFAATAEGVYRLALFP